MGMGEERRWSEALDLHEFEGRADRINVAPNLVLSLLSNRSILIHEYWDLPRLDELLNISLYMSTLI